MRWARPALQAVSHSRWPPILVLGLVRSPSNSLQWGGDPCVAAWPGVACEGSAVRTLSLGGLGLRGTLPTLIGMLTAMTSMDLNTNSLSGKVGVSGLAHKGGRTGPHEEALAPHVNSRPPPPRALPPQGPFLPSLACSPLRLHTSTSPATGGRAAFRRRSLASRMSPLSWCLEILACMAPVRLLSGPQGPTKRREPASARPPQPPAAPRMPQPAT